MNNTKKIEVVPYTPEWVDKFEVEAEKIKQTLGDNLKSIHHIGSTSIPGLIAKPIIDMIAVVKKPKEAIGILETLSYNFRGEYNIPFRFYFSKQGEIAVNLHIYEENHPEIELNLKFRDYLRSNSKARDDYAVLKENLLLEKASFVKAEGQQFTGYNLGKDAFIRNILRATQFNQLRFMKCAHYAEWEAARHYRQTYFFDKISIEDPYTWTFNQESHVHFILYLGLDIIGYAHLQLWPQKRAALRIIVVEPSKRNKGYGEKFFLLIEKWLIAQNYNSIHIESSPEALTFYQKYNYVNMPFNDPDEYESHPQDIPIGKIFTS